MNPSELRIDGYPLFSDLHGGNALTRAAAEGTDEDVRAAKEAAQEAARAAEPSRAQRQAPLSLGACLV